jgi:hypothetical protein
MRACLATAALSLLTPTLVRADEGGVSFWAPGQFGSFSATPSEPGFAVPVVYYPASADAGRSKNFLVGGNLTLGIDATGDLLFFFPTYTFKEPVLGGQAAFGLGWAVGNLDGTADVTLTGPQGNTFTEDRTEARRSVTSSRACRLSARRSGTSSQSARKKGT